MHLPLPYCVYLSLFVLLVTARDNSTNCKCLPSDSCWPSSSELAALSNSIDGRLIRGNAPASVCYQNNPVYNPAACKEVFSQWTSSAWHAADPVSVDAPNVNGGCYPVYPNGTNYIGDSGAGTQGCQSELWYPAFVVNATKDAHVQAGVRFAKKHNLRLSVKNTGHAGARTAVPGSLSIWTHHFKDIHFNQSWRPQGCSLRNESRMAMSFGAGVQDREAFEAAATHDAVVVGGTDSTVGLVGWLSGGGHGYLTGTYGMGADNLVEARVVTLNGDVVVANECQNRDILWAIRGGGPSFGILTSLVMKAYPMPTTNFWSLSLTAKNGTSDKRFYEVAAELMAELPALKAAGVQGYLPIGGPPLAISGALFAYNAPNGSVEAAAAPVLEKLQQYSDVVSISSSMTFKHKWIDIYHFVNLTLGASGGAGAVASRLLTAESLTEDVDLVAQTLLEVGPSSEHDFGNISQPAISESFVASSKPVDNALNPAWRDTVVHFRVSNSWSSDIPKEEADAATRNMTEVTGRALRQLAPDSGAYFNEADANEPNWQWSLFGTNYPRLLALKQKYDPTGLLWCSHCVGSEYWVAGEGGKLCRADFA